MPAVGISWGGITRAPTLLESDSLPGLTANSIHDSGRVHPAPKPFVDEPYTARIEPVTWKRINDGLDYWTLGPLDYWAIFLDDFLDDFFVWVGRFGCFFFNFIWVVM